MMKMKISNPHIIGVLILGFTIILCFMSYIFPCAFSGHKWEEANCFHAKRCTICKKTEGEALSPTGAHKWKEATCEHGSTCVYCGEVRTDPLPHEYGDDYICTVCGKKDPESAFNVWEIKYYVDEFENPTSQKYITNKRLISGKFSNSATTDSELSVKLLYDRINGFAFEFWEYGNLKVKTYGKKEYKILMLNSEGEKTNLEGVLYSSSERVYVSGTSKIIDALSAGDVSFYIVDKEYRINKYQFELKSSNFSNEYKKLLE